MSVTRRSFLSGLAACPLCAAVARAETGHPHWTYEGHGGPKEWGALSADFQACALGSQQSPVDLDGAVETAQKPLAITWTAQPFKVVNNGHTIQADALTGANSVALAGKAYELKQFHFHAPSEHAIGGVRTAMEVHFVHARPEGGLAVVGVFMTPGVSNAAFAAVMAAAPKAEGVAAAQPVIDISTLLPASRRLYRYEGSLTTPPCAEVVDWNVFAAPMAVAQADIDAFRAIFPMNARPLQAINRRFLLQMN
ncbi:carbonic anhydrase [Xanthobacter tagetidis]|uniref:carbonic anhydrase n=1 Tax=Xanthobacter tagetidis TaxID=60216 RepID=A0A3L7AK23_9HYPH|nr:carbonic anhydrase family protein [Xanthobacter tagetidis]MBB6307005.1 carbonic anhydrase [Xanthobacter tagetidis]RLP79941.1 carbonic anhydrase family protein [Xanthobacter tagetidis]